MLTHIQVVVGQGLCMLLSYWVGHLFRFLLMTLGICCAFLPIELHFAVQFNVCVFCTPR